MLHLALNGIRYYWRTNLGVFAGATLASAVLTGALLVGNSVDHSLETFAKLRLGTIEFAMTTQQQFILQDLPNALSANLDTDVAAALQVRGMAIYQGDTAEDRTQVNQVEVLGIAEDFWEFSNGSGVVLGPNETAINQKLAIALGVTEGDEISLRVAKPSLLARDAPLSMRGEERTRRGRYTVKRIVPDDELGRFSLSPSQVAPYNAFVSREWLQEQVELENKINLVLIGSGPSLTEVKGALQRTWQPEHIGLSITSYDNNVIQLASERIYLSSEASRAAFAVPDAEGTLTYLANGLTAGDHSTPYSFVVAGPVPEDMNADEVVINRWLADALHVDVGGSVSMAYFELLSSSDFEEQTKDFTVHSIREMDGLIQERELTPTFPGLSDVDSCAEWDVGMPMDEDLLNDEQNEIYWEKYRQTPKAFITLEAGQALWANRFGNLSAVRFPGGPDRAQAIRESLSREMRPDLAGLFVLPVGASATAAVSEAMDFGGLFIGMSFFLIVAALMLTGLLFVFGVQQRATEMGSLLALGYRPATVRRLLLSEGTVIALGAAVLGAGLGTFYTRLLLFGLSQYWQGAVAGAAIRYHAEPVTLVMGAGISLTCAVCTMAIAIWRQAKRPARDLLSMDFSQESETDDVTRKRGLYVSLGCGAVAVLIVLSALVVDFSQLMIPFFGAGSLLLISGIGLCRHALLQIRQQDPAGMISISRLAITNIARRRGRSLAVIGLLASGCFMVIAVSAMQEDLHAHAHHRSSGTGGFALFADSTFPLLDDPIEALDDPEVSATAIKVRSGDDASCLNLNHAQTPSVLGVNAEDMESRGAFAPPELWQLLDLERDDGAIPALVGDKNTAMWTLKKKTGETKGDVLLYHNEDGNEVRIKLVGAIPSRLSVFQGTILISKAAFAEIFPSEAGHRMFLIDTPEGAEVEVAAELNRKHDRLGMNAFAAVDRLLEFYAVETTYLAMFLVLGGLGLAIGSVGMGVVVLRNLLERRREMAMLQALGYSRAPVYKILFIEYGTLLIAGLGIGSISAVISTLPALFATESQVNVAVQLNIGLLVLLTSTACMSVAILAGARKSDLSALRAE